MIRREQTAELANRIANDPAVYGSVCYHGQAVDFEPAMCSCVILTNGEDAMSAFEQTAERVWQGHSFFLPSCRGRRAIDVAKEMVEWMRPWADALWGATPLGNRAARWFNRQVGFVSAGFDEYEAEGPVELFEMRFV